MYKETVPYTLSLDKRENASRKRRAKGGNQMLPLWS